MDSIPCVTNSLYCSSCLRRYMHFTDRLSHSCLNSCCPAPCLRSGSSKAELSSSPSRGMNAWKSFLLTLFWCFQGTSSYPGSGRFCPFMVGGGFNQRTKVDKSFQLWVWMPENFSRSTSCTKYNLPLRASKLSPLFSTICFFCGQHILCKIQREIEWTVLKPIGGRWDTYIPQITTASLQLHTFLRVCSLAVGSAAYKIMYMISSTSTLHFYLLYFHICVCVCGF